MARVKYLQRSDVEGVNDALFDRLERERKVPTANIFRALAHAPDILDQFLSYANAIRASSISPKLRELAILTVGHCTGSEYEIAHHQSHGLKAGISPEQLKAIPDFETSTLFNEEERAVMAVAMESTLKVAVSDKTWNRVVPFLNDQQRVELALNIAWYNSGVRIMGALGIELEESYR
ncbi:Alkylhydroperoxidase family enzyme, contains CxxC motif [Paraburkholderia steynii]|uniref:Alkylhydroperoxidase family enzyme, contains CxxC motif n=1 Tax=Paraburkholderia steynii TaxID=1245441 RepID=A0A7Z7FJF7_9BURK|nr:carboxymuconolactone decarboxylase family protein [Paraburkholderia steynii]SDI52407.1 Alkylhydroperoxidase family enzyme, contains CxxC motif [Paraburkholderia steynii]